MANFEQSRTIAAPVADIRSAINEINKQAPTGQGFVWNQAKTSAKTTAPDGSTLEVRLARADSASSNVTVAMETPAELGEMEMALMAMLAPQILDQVLSVIETLATRGVGLGL